MSRSPRPLLVLAATASLLVASAGLFPAHADPTPSGETIATAGNGAGSAPCASCHGPEGGGNDAAGFPALAGLDAGYLARQVRLIRDGERASAVMAAGLASLTDEQVDAVAAYYAGLPPVAPTAEPPDDAQATVAQALVEVGDWPGRDLPACSSCHGPGARGVNAAFPALAGQHAGYLASQLRAWQTGERSTDPGDLMGTVARKLTDAEIDAVSAWLAAQPQGGAR